MAVVVKTRPAADRAVAVQCLGDVRGRHCLILDDMASTGGTAASAAQVLFQAGAAGVHAIFIHAVMAGDALQRLKAAGIERIAATDSLPDTEGCAGIARIPVAPLLARTILRLAAQPALTRA
jgi:ribose-phosphate pyrophosphokinase